MEIIGKISKGTNMDQIYISKQRDGMPIGEYVLIKPITIDEKIKIEEKKKQKYYFYGVKEIEPIKLKIIKEIFNVISKINDKIDNVIITGSFLDEGFKFNDIDILIMSNSNIDHSIINNRLKNLTGVKTHLIILTNKELLAGISTDPLYQSMLSKCVSMRRIIYNIDNKVYRINYKLLDLQLLKSKIVLDSFDYLNGAEVYYYLYNLISIYLFLKNKRITKSEVENKIKNLFGDKDKIKSKIIDKKEFLREYKVIYHELFSVIMDNIRKENGSKQK
ncbi:hypothetical protein J4205_02140 [Candidatus Pacearchaeota archaeon]|nr:hypothetical protein [Candidatus Pacearchaeota archaeon]